MFRARFARDIVTEFLPPLHKVRRQRVVLVATGMPSLPNKQPILEFLSRKGFWAFFPRWRGSWESGGEFLKISPEQDLFDVIDQLPLGFRETAFGRRFRVRPDEVFVIGGSFGGAAALLASLDPRVTRVVANCPVVDWGVLDEEQEKETSNPSYPAYIREAFGNAYRLPARNWNKLRKGRFFNPAVHLKEFDSGKVLIFHAQDDPYIPWRSVAAFAKQTGIKMKLLARGGHVSTQWVTTRHWPQIARFFSTIRRKP
jgi:pimeloyl-ACP methyl ester carboxylesterase